MSHVNAMSIYVFIIMKQTITNWRCSRCGMTNGAGSCKTCGSSNRRDINPMLGLLNNGNYSGHVSGNVYNVHGPMSVVDHFVEVGPGFDNPKPAYNPKQLPAHVEKPVNHRDGIKEFCARGMYIGGLMTLCLGFLSMFCVFCFFAWVIYSAYAHAVMVG